MLFRWSVRVYFEDTDAGGVVYHASYVALYERARTEMLRQHHFNQQALLEKQVGFVVRRITVDSRNSSLALCCCYDGLNRCLFFLVISQRFLAYLFGINYCSVAKEELDRLENGLSCCT